MINRIFSVFSDFHNEMCYEVSIDKSVSSDTDSVRPARGFVISLLAALKNVFPLYLCAKIILLHIDCL